MTSGWSLGSIPESGAKMLDPDKFFDHYFKPFVIVVVGAMLAWIGFLGWAVYEIVHWLTTK